MGLFRDNDPWHFGSLHLALLSLFRASTLEDWTDIMYINIFGCDVYGYDGMAADCTRPHASGGIAVLYFIIFVVIAALVLITLFIGVVTTSMEQAREETEAEMNVEKRLEEFKNLEGLSNEEVANYRQVFGMLDLDAGGTISEAELKTGLEAVGKKLNESQIHFMMSQVDANSNGEIDMAEFVEFLTYMRRGIIVTNPSLDEKPDDATPSAPRVSGDTSFREKLAGEKTGNFAFDQKRLDEGLNQWAMLLGLNDEPPDSGQATTTTDVGAAQAIAEGRDEYGIPCLKISADPVSTLDSLDAMLAGVNAATPGAMTPNRRLLPPLAHSPSATPTTAPPRAKATNSGLSSKVHVGD